MAEEEGTEPTLSWSGAFGSGGPEGEVRSLEEGRVFVEEACTNLRSDRSRCVQVEGRRKRGEGCEARPTNGAPFLLSVHS